MSTPKDNTLALLLAGTTLALMGTCALGVLILAPVPVARADVKACEASGGVLVPGTGRDKYCINRAALVAPARP